MALVYIFGASTFGEFVLKNIQHTQKISGFIDNDVNKQGKYFCGLPVYSPSILENSDAEIIIASSYADQIEHQLQDMNFFNYRISQLTTYQPSLKTSRLIDNNLSSISAGAIIDSVGSELSISDLTFLNGGSSVMDYFFLKAVSLKQRTKTFLEIGTWTGESIASLAETVECCISISLPDNDSNLVDVFNRYCNKESFSRFFSYQHNNIIHYQENSATFDYNKIKRQIDLVFIDGDHSYQGIKKDTTNIFEKCGYNDTIVIWHDFKTLRNELVQTTYQAVMDSIPEQYQNNVYAVQGTYCGIYIPEKFKRFLELRENRSSIYSYEVSILPRLNTKRHTNPNPINIVFASDNQYVQHLITTITSVLENTQYSTHININILDGGISEENKDYITHHIESYGSSVSFLQVDRSVLNNVVVNGHITEATYYRILIPSLFDDKVSKVLYLDCDLIVRDDIYKLWNIDIGDYALGAVKLNEYRSHRYLGIPETASYFNAGVMIMNLDKWKNNNIAQKVFDFIAKYPERLHMWDQDALNAVLYNDWFQIDYSWNLRSQMFEMDYVKAGISTEDQFESLKKNPSIVHFTTSSKPWHYLNQHPLKQEYFKYLHLSNYPYTLYPEIAFLLNKEIVVFGTGKAAEQSIEIIHKYPVQVKYYVDNNNEKWNKNFAGRSIKSPNVLVDHDDVLVVIASQYEKEISEQLLEMGLVENLHFVRHYSKLLNLR